MEKNEADYIIDKLAGKVPFYLIDKASGNYITVAFVGRKMPADECPHLSGKRYKRVEETLEEYLQRHNNNNTTEIEE